MLEKTSSAVRRGQLTDINRLYVMGLGPRTAATILLGPRLRDLVLVADWLPSCLHQEIALHMREHADEARGVGELAAACDTLTCMWSREHLCPAQRLIGISLGTVAGL